MLKNDDGECQPVIALEINVHEKRNQLWSLSALTDESLAVLSPVLWPAERPDWNSLNIRLNRYMSPSSRNIAQIARATPNIGDCRGTHTSGTLKDSQRIQSMNFSNMTYPDQMTVETLRPMLM
jgi:hypothetical protein